MATTPVPAFVAPPDFPALSDRALGTYNSKAFAWATAMQSGTGPNIHALATTAKANADDAALSATAAADSAALALSDGAAQVALAEAEAITAQQAANAAAATAGATQWVSGATYAAGVCVWSPINLQVYRRKTTGAGTTDPSADGANWSFVGAKPSLVRSARTSNTPIGAADISTLIDITSGTFTQTFNSAASLGSGWYCYLRNSGTGDVTLDPSGAETIDGLANFVMYPGEVRLVQCDGVALRTVVLNAFYKVFEASGTFNKPPGYSFFEGWLFGGGGSGAASSSNNNAVTNAGGGGGGGACQFIVKSSQLQSAESVLVGSGGAAKDATDAQQLNGNAGGQTGFFGFIAPGGGGGNATTDTTTAAGGSGGAPFTPFLKVNGGNGGQVSATASNGGPGATGGGGGAKTSGFGAGGSGASYFAGGNGGNGAYKLELGGVAVASSGSAPGGGGGGAAATWNTGSVSATSGAGARGELRIWGVI